MLGGGGLSEDNGGGNGGVLSGDGGGDNVPSQRQNPLLRLLTPNQNSRNLFIVFF